MGVHGLTLYLRENKRLLSRSLEFTSKSTAGAPVVVDGWSFIYELANRSNLPWVYGGEYQEFSRLVLVVAKAWIDVGLKVAFVFDGPTPELKFPTAISRLTQSHVQPSLLFFRTSSASRSTPWSLHESRIIPPLLYLACIQALQSLSSDNLEVHFADEEGDPYAVELASRIGGYVVGNDSDFVVLNSEGYKGYIPLEEMVWSTTIDEDVLGGGDDGEFETVRKAKGKKKISDPRLGRGIIPPDSPSGLTLTLNYYQPSLLASHLKLPVTLLPLLGALVGNDFSSQALSTQRTAQSLFFQRNLTLPQRINHVASTLVSIISASSQKRKPKHQVGSVMDLIDKAVDALLVRSRSAMGSGEVETIINTIVEATLQYAIPKYDIDTQGQFRLWPTPVCALHEPELCPLLPLFSRSFIAEDENDSEGEENEEQIMREQVRELYVKAYRAGLLSPKILNVLNTCTSWPRLFLENPDTENVARSVGRPIRQWGYAILEDGIGLPARLEGNSDENSPVEADSNDDDELVDVVEEDSDEEMDGNGIGGDPLALLKGELQRLRAPGDDDDSDAPRSLSSSRSRPPKPKQVVEYIRKGTRVAGEEVDVPFIVDLMAPLGTDNPTSLQLRSVDDRLTIFLHALGSNIPSVQSLPSEQLVVVVALRWVIRTFGDRARNSGGTKEREKERWTQNEALALLASFPWGPNSQESMDDSSLPEDNAPPIIDRNVQLTAQILMALESIVDFTQILFLSERAPTCAHLLSGKLFHSYLTGIKPLVLSDVHDRLWHATSDGLEDAFGVEWTKKPKKSSKTKTSSSPGQGVRKKSATVGGLFGLLGDMEA